MGTYLEVGQTIFLEPRGNAARYNKDLIETKISKIGKKYFTVTENWYGRFYIENLMQDRGDYMSEYRAILDKQQLLDEKEESELINFIKDRLRVFDLPRLRDMKLFIESKTK